MGGAAVGYDAGNESHKQDPRKHKDTKTPADNHVKPGLAGAGHFAPVDTIGSNNPPVSAGTGPNIRAAHPPPRD